MADDNVVSFVGETKLPIPVEQVLEQALEAHRERPFNRVLVIACYDEEGDTDYEASSEPCAATNSWDAQRFIHGLHVRADNEFSKGQ
jgi:hypothetical protein